MTGDGATLTVAWLSGAGVSALALLLWRRRRALRRARSSPPSVGHAPVTGTWKLTPTQEDAPDTHPIRPPGDDKPRNERDWGTP